MSHRSFGKSRPRYLLHLVLLMAVIVTVLPLLVVVNTSLQLPRDIISGGLLASPSFYNFESTFTTYRFGRLFVNSLTAAAGATVTVLVVASLASYSLAKFRWPKWWIGLAFGLLLLIQMLPPVVFSGPFYLLSRRLGIYNTPFALIMAYLVLQTPLAVLVLHRFAVSIPEELIQAAQIDGARNWTIFTLISLPLMAPGLATAALLTFIFSWNDFMFAVSLTSTVRAMTVPVGIANFAQDFRVMYGNITAAATFAVIPALIIVIIAQRYVTRGLTIGAIKG